jgi:hypothetical protein
MRSRVAERKLWFMGFSAGFDPSIPARGVSRQPADTSNFYKVD